MSSCNHSRKPQSWEHLLEKDPLSGTGFRLGVAAAVLIHAGIFAITWPTVAQAPPEEPEQIVHRYPLTDYVPSEPDRPPPLEFEIPTFVDEASIIVPGSPEEISSEPIEREVPPIPINIAGPVEFIDPPPPPPDPPKNSGEPMRLMRPPEAIHRIQPLYTEPARRAGVEGIVILELVIDTRGAVESVKVLRGLPLGLTESAVRAAEQWQFEPCVFNDRPTAVRFVLTVSFNLT